MVSELGPIRYMQDETRRLSAAYDFGNNQSGGGRFIRGCRLLIIYNSLLEIGPNIIDHTQLGNPVPAPLPVTLTDGWVEMEGYLGGRSGVFILPNRHFFKLPDQGTKYDVTDGIGSAQVRIQTSTNIDGTS